MHADVADPPGVGTRMEGDREKSFYHEGLEGREGRKEEGGKSFYHEDHEGREGGEEEEEEV